MRVYIYFRIRARRLHIHVHSMRGMRLNHAASSYDFQLTLARDKHAVVAGLADKRRQNFEPTMLHLNCDFAEKISHFTNVPESK